MISIWFTNFFYDKLVPSLPLPIRYREERLQRKWEIVKKTKGSTFSFVHSFWCRVPGAAWAGSGSAQRQVSVPLSNGNCVDVYKNGLNAPTCSKENIPTFDVNSAGPSGLPHPYLPSPLPCSLMTSHALLCFLPNPPWAIFLVLGSSLLLPDGTFCMYFPFWKENVPPCT